MLQDGRVTINGRRAIRAAQLIAADDAVVVTDVPATVAAPRPEKPGKAAAPSLDVLHEDDHLLMVDKPPGLLTSTVPRERRPTLLAMVRAHVEAATGRGGSPRVGLIHRLDRDASGLLVFSKTHEAYLSLKRQFFEHTVEREYSAVAEGVPTPRAGRVQSRLVER